LAVGEGYALEDAAAEGCYQEMSDSNFRVQFSDTYLSQEDICA
jgi:hypothetical protein